MKYPICTTDCKNFNSLDNRRDSAVYTEHWNVRLLVKCTGHDVAKHDSAGHPGTNLQNPDLHMDMIHLQIDPQPRIRADTSQERSLCVLRAWHRAQRRGGRKHESDVPLALPGGELPVTSGPLLLVPPSGTPPPLLLPASSYSAFKSQLQRHFLRSHFQSTHDRL